ncbi:MAG: hypothetical protein K9W46_01120 [Candidatus Heimdallarchaeum endolithica]|uniref:ABC3 transporter permease protein domain-containing protein n=1 Tax=Candidatus Heimdallarchaeum endolithica TaxID=2876572 RepID=A0A9Y1BRN8_9ARCH|nr:MAG: hypothetical protein K9W46_01120 [Candidatus Heimdallarchaeum endolithica]
MKLKRKYLVFILIVMISISSNYFLVNGEIDDNSKVQEEILGYFQAYESLVDLETRALLDSQGKLHIFIKMDLENQSFTIFHLFEGNLSKVKTDLSSGTIFNAFNIDDKIVLFYSYHGNFGQFNIDMYVWESNQKESNSLVYHSSFFGNYFIYNVQLVDNVFYLLFAEPMFESAMDEHPTTKFKKLTVFLNGTSTTKNWFTNLEYNGIQSFLIVDGELVALYKYMFFPTRLIGVYIINDEPYLSNYITFNTDYDVYLSLFNRTTLNFALIKGSTFYTHNFKLNESLSFKNFSEFQLGMYSYYDFYHYSFDSSITFLINPNPHLPLDSNNTRGGLITDFTILKYNGKNISQQFIDIPFTSNITIFDSTYINFQTPSTFLVSRTQRFTGSRLINKIVIEQNIFSLLIFSNTNISTNWNTKPVIYDLTLVNFFEYVFKMHWIELTVTFIVIIIVIAIFYKKMLNQAKKLFKYLLRPIKTGKNKFILILLNLWVFIVSSLSLPFDLWRSNKKRAIITILGLSILAMIVFSSSSLFSHKQNMMIQRYLEDAHLEEDEKASATFSRMHNVLSARWGRVNEYSPFYENFSSAVMNEILSSIALQTKVLKDIIIDSDFSMQMRILFKKDAESSIQSVESYYSLSSNYKKILEEILISGRLPDKINEIIIDETTAIAFNKTVNDTIIFVGADVSVGGLKERVNMTIVGIYEKPTEPALFKMSRDFGLSYDLVKMISQYIGAITFNDFYLSSLKTMPVQHLKFDGTIQFFYDFSLVNSKNMGQLIEDFNTLQPGYDHPVNFDLGGSWVISTELKLVLLSLVPSYSSTQFLLVLLSIPVLYLALFLIFETNALFATSFDEEIKILRSKGLSTAKIVYLNTVMKFVESLIATFLGLGEAILIIPLLLKLDKFVSFNLDSIMPSFKNLPLIFIVSFFGLIVITLPLTIRMAKIKKEQIRDYNKFVSFLKKVKIGNYFIIAVGGGIIYGGFKLYQTFSENLSSSENQLINIFVYIIGIGVMITLFGLGLILKDFHSFIMAVLSKTLWKIKKNMFTFSLVEVKTDISLFNDIFLTYLLLVGIAVPAIAAPLTMQNGILEDSYFMSGSDMYINNYNKVNSSISNEIEALPEVVDICNVSQVDAMFGGRQLNLLVIQNASDFYNTAYKPSERFFKNWDDIIPQLDNEKEIIVSSNFKFFFDISEMKYLFNDIEMKIIDEFDYFPIIYPYGPRESGGTPMIVLTESNYEKIEESLTIFGIFGYRLLINVADKTDIVQFSSSLEEKYNLEIINVVEKEHEIYQSNLPFYSSIVSIFVFSLLICTISIIFTSMSNPLKILQRRMGKHDILKKMGIPNKLIIQMSSFELFMIGILPGLIGGTAVGFTITEIIRRVLRSLREEMLPNPVQFPPVIALMIFLVIPAMFFSIFYITMKMQFARYQPMNLE